MRTFAAALVALLAGLGAVALIVALTVSTLSA